MQINPETRMSIFFQLGYVLAVPWARDRTLPVNFQKALLEGGLEFSQTNVRENGYMLIRNQPSNLQVRLESPAPQVSSLQITSQNPAYDLGMFGRDCAAVTGAYQQTFSADQYQAIRTNAKIQHLYSCSVHPFKYLWEVRLGQKGEDLRCLGDRPVAGGGMRFIMPPHAREGEQLRSVEVRIESFLREPGKILVETAFTWPQPRVIGKDERFEPADCLRVLEEYATREVWQFLTLEKKD